MLVDCVVRIVGWRVVCVVVRLCGGLPFGWPVGCVVCRVVGCWLVWLVGGLFGLCVGLLFGRVACGLAGWWVGHVRLVVRWVICG